MDLLYAMRDLGVADPGPDSTGEQTVRAALAQEIDKATSARRPDRARRTRPRLLAGASLALACLATAVALLLSATASPPPAFAVTRLRDGSVAVKINRRSGIAGANRKLAALGIHERLYAVSTSLSGVSHPQLPVGMQSCLRDQQTGGVVQVFFPSAAAQKAAVGTGTYVPPSNAGNTGGPPNKDTFVVVSCPVGNPGSAASGNTGNTGGAASGNTANPDSPGSGPTHFAEPVSPGNTSATGAGKYRQRGQHGRRLNPVTAVGARRARASAMKRLAVRPPGDGGGRTAVLWPWLLVAGAVGWNLVNLRALTFGVAYVNDSSIHEQMVRFATAQLRAGHLPLTSWFRSSGQPRAPGCQPRCAASRSCSASTGTANTPSCSR